MALSKPGRQLHFRASGNTSSDVEFAEGVSDLLCWLSWLPVAVVEAGKAKLPCEVVVRDIGVAGAIIPSGVFPGCHRSRVPRLDSCRGSPIMELSGTKGQQNSFDSPADMLNDWLSKAVDTGGLVVSGKRLALPRLC